MGKLDASILRYMSRDEFRVLTAVEMGMRNHDLVPEPLIVSIAGLRHGGAHKIITTLLRNRLICHEAGQSNGYRLTNSGYDYLALRTFLARGHIVGLGPQIGIGKESDIFLAQQEDGTEVAIKFHRLGRTSFRAVKNKRDYLLHRKSASWLYMSRLAALKEYAFMKALYARDFPVPTPIDQNRHAVLMQLIDGYPLYQVRNLQNSEAVYNKAMSILVRLAKCGLVHCDYNEFNLLVNDDGHVTMIDFPQMVSTSHPNAEELFNRDVRGVVKFFSRLQGGAYTPDKVPNLQEETQEIETRLDVEVEASGFTKEMDNELLEKMEQLQLETEHAEEGERLLEINFTDGEDSDENENAENRQIERVVDSGDDVGADEDEVEDGEEQGAEADNGTRGSTRRGRGSLDESAVKQRIKQKVKRQGGSRGGGVVGGSRNFSKQRVKGRRFHQERFD